MSCKSDFVRRRQSRSSTSLFREGKACVRSLRAIRPENLCWPMSPPPTRAPAGGIPEWTRLFHSSLRRGRSDLSSIWHARIWWRRRAERPGPCPYQKVIDKARREGVLAALEAVRAKLDSPIPLGYSLAGRVADAGISAREFARGDRVACAGAGYANHADVNAVPKNLAVHIPDEVNDEEAAFVTVGAIALQGVRLAKPELGNLVVVIGLGLIGADRSAALGGARMRRGRDRYRPRKGGSGARARRRGWRCSRGRRRDRGRARDVEWVWRRCCSNYSVVADKRGCLALAGDLARDRARISVVGLMPLEIPRKAYYEKELEVVVSRSYGPGRYDADYEERGHDYPIGYVRWTERRNLQALYCVRSLARRLRA